MEKELIDAYLCLDNRDISVVVKSEKELNYLEIAVLKYVKEVLELDAEYSGLCECLLADVENVGYLFSQVEWHKATYYKDYVLVEEMQYPAYKLEVNKRVIACVLFSRLSEGLEPARDEDEEILEDISSSDLENASVGLQALLKDKAKNDGYIVIVAESNGFKVEMLEEECGAYLTISCSLVDKTVKYAYKGNKTHKVLDYIIVT